VTTAELSVVPRRTDGESVLELTGEIDLSTTDQLRSAVEEALATPGVPIVLDFSGVTFCDSQGLSTLLSLSRRATAAGTTLALVNVGDFLVRLLDITGLRSALSVRDA
jgi:anti-sigma B factor antagonist